MHQDQINKIPSVVQLREWIFKSVSSIVVSKHKWELEQKIPIVWSSSITFVFPTLENERECYSNILVFIFLFFSHFFNVLKKKKIHF